ncbi:hypothetical protein PY257_11915, partial [Ramlibacter sp. H39-3-26]|uniref:hypothetical protein n=1 Tax=Curvibacter soli TaxID=3031331 RepID=UPI0023DC7BD3
WNPRSTPVEAWAQAKCADEATVWCLLREGQARLRVAGGCLRIPANVTADSDIVTGDSGERDRGRCCALRLYVGADRKLSHF